MDKFPRRKRSEIMAKVRSRGNASTELKALRILRQSRITGWRRHLPIVGHPDFAFPKQRIAVFVDGCFWHGCPRCYRAPQSSKGYWRAKVRRNRRRDRAVTRQLQRDGWTVVRVWECQLKTPTRFLNKLKSCASSM